jgi:hypothetical protein
MPYVEPQCRPSVEGFAEMRRFVLEPLNDLPKHGNYSAAAPLTSGLSLNLSNPLRHMLGEAHVKPISTAERFGQPYAFVSKKRRWIRST